MSKKFFWRVIAGVVLVIVAPAIYYWNHLFEYELVLNEGGDGEVKIQTVTLGEYYTPVSVLTISEAKENRKVVELIAKSKKSRMHTLTLKYGINEFSDTYLEGYHISYNGNGPYAFQKGVSYRVSVNWSNHEGELTFVLD